MRARVLDAADAWINSPIAVATSFLSYANRHRLTLNVQSMPMIPGTRRPSSPVVSISRGILIPNSRQGKLGLGIRVAFNVLNPLLGLTTYGVNRASRFADLQELLHQRGSDHLSGMADIRGGHTDLLAIKREQAMVFGTNRCWKAQERKFALLEKQARELAVISPAESSRLLRKGEPFLLSRYYEEVSKYEGSDGNLTAGMQSCSGLGCGGNMIQSLLPSSVRIKKPDGPFARPSIPNRREIRQMAYSRDPSVNALAFRLMTAVIDYKLSSYPTARGTTADFDPDWQLYLQVGRANALHVEEVNPAWEGVRACSAREFQAGIGTKLDAYQDSRTLTSRLAREGRDLLSAPVR